MRAPSPEDMKDKDDDSSATPTATGTAPETHTPRRSSSSSSGGGGSEPSTLQYVLEHSFDGGRVWSARGAAHVQFARSGRVGGTAEVDTPAWTAQESAAFKVLIHPQWATG
jgi:hypothetical protein